MVIIKPPKKKKKNTRLPSLHLFPPHTVPPTLYNSTKWRWTTHSLIPFPFPKPFSLQHKVCLFLYLNPLPFPLSNKKPKEKGREKKNIKFGWSPAKTFSYIYTTTDGDLKFLLHSLFECCFPLVVKKKSCLWLKMFGCTLFCSILYLHFSSDGGFFKQLQGS